MSGHNPCAACHINCCYDYIVPLYGVDVWSLARAQKLPPEQFAAAYTLPVQRPETFRLEKDGTWHGMALDKQGEFDLKKPCVFLVSLAGEFKRCGIYADRPLVCQAYPMTSKRGGGLGLRDQPLCPEGAWPRSEQLRPYWRGIVQKTEMAADVYTEVVARWNARVEATPGVATMNEYFSYLMTVYDNLAELDAELGEAHMQRVRETWRTAPSPESTPDEVRARPDDFPWIHYLDRAAEIVGQLYPWVPRERTERVVLSLPIDPDVPPVPEAERELTPAGTARWP